MSLKLSMSTSSSAAPPGRAAHSASHPVIRRRFATPVSGSWSARNASSCRARWASVTSRAVPSTRDGTPAASANTSPKHSKTRSVRRSPSTMRWV